MRKKKKIIASILFILVLFLGSTLGQDYNNREIISIEINPDILNRLKTIPLDYLMEQNNRLYIVASFRDLDILKTQNIPFVIESETFYRRHIEGIFAQSSINGAFHSYREVEKEMTDLAQNYSSIAKLVDIGDSLEGRNIYALKISGNVNIDENEPGIIITGCHHAREWISVEVPLLLCKHLVENYASNPDIYKLVNLSEIWIVPLVNPDGLEYTIHYYRYWRKNRRDNGSGSFGVDPNRNYGFMWGYDNIGSSSNPDSGTYRGTAPFSEPETQAIRDLFPGHDFQALLSYHSFSQVILYPWGYKKEPSPNENLLRGMAQDMSDLMRQVNGRVYDVQRAGADFYLTNGDTTDWSYGTYSIPSFTFELPPVDQSQGGFFNAESDIQAIFNENLPALLYLINWSILNWDGTPDNPGPASPARKARKGENEKRII